MNYDIKRMRRALNTPVNEVQEGLSREGIKELILSKSVNMKKAAEAGNAGMRYWEKHGVFPTTKEQIEPFKLNSSERLPPTDVNLIIVVDGQEVTAKRPTWYLGNPSDDLTYIKLDGEILKGRFMWRYL